MIFSMNVFERGASRFNRKILMFRGITESGAGMEERTLWSAYRYTHRHRLTEMP